MGKDRQKKRKHEDKRSQGAEGDRETARGKKNKKDGRTKPQESVRASRAADSRSSAAAAVSASCSKSEDQQQAEDQQEEKGLEQRRSYSRRKIVSNWTRYEEPPDDEEESVRVAAAMSKLKIQMAASSRYEEQFYNQTDESWNSAADDQQDVTSPLVSLECEKLAASLQFIPVHEQLFMDKHWFDPATLTAIEAESLSSMPVERLRPIRPLPRDYDLEYLKKCFSHKPKVTNTGTRKSLLIETSLSDTTQQQQTSAHNTEQLESTQTVKKNFCQQDEQAIALESDPSDGSYSGQTHCKDSHYEKTQPQVNDSCTVPKASPLETNIKENATEQTSNSETQELEDWLESVLD